MSVDISWQKFKRLDISDDLMKEMDDVEELEEEEPTITFFKGSAGKSPFIGWYDGEHPQLIRLGKVDKDLDWNDVKDLLDE